jgi:hypothetical protein
MARRIAGRSWARYNRIAQPWSVLDWFHIGKKFQTVQNALGEALEASLERAKWKLWHGKAEEALAKLALLRNNITDEAHKSKMTGLYNYIERNQAYIVNYDERATAHQTLYEPSG